MIIKRNLLSRAQSVLAGGTGTFSKHSSRYPAGLAPDALVRGNGPYVWDTQGRRFLDTVAALGPILLGHGHFAVTEAIIHQLAHGTSFSMLHPLEVEVAELLCEVIPCAEMVRFARNGTDVTNATVRLARAITGHQHMLFMGYAGGGMDSYGITTDKAAGILPQLHPYNHQLAWGNVSTVPRHAWNDLAGIMIEVPPFPWGSPSQHDRQTLQAYHKVAHDCGALFILDEIVTWPRYGLAGAQGVYDITPDLCTVSKAIANGVPLAALVGQRQYMERLNQGDIFMSYTFAGETTALAAAKAVLTILRDTDALANLHKQGTRLGDGLQVLFHEYALPATLWGNYARLSVRWQDVPGVATNQELRTLWLAEMARRGVLWGIGVCFVMACWTERETTMCLEVARDVCALMASAIWDGHVQEVLPCPVIGDVLAVR